MTFGDIANSKAPRKLVRRFVQRSLGNRCRAGPKLIFQLDLLPKDSSGGDTSSFVKREGKYLGNLSKIWKMWKICGEFIKQMENMENIWGIYKKYGKYEKCVGNSLNIWNKWKICAKLIKRLEIPPDICR